MGEPRPVSLSLPAAGPGPAFVHAHSPAPRWQDAAAACARTIAASGIGANLGFVYVTDSHAADLAAVVRVLRESSGVEHWVGTVGIGVCATGVEYLDRPAIVTLAGAFPQDGFRLLPSMDDPSALPEGLYACGAQDANLAVLHADPSCRYLLELIGGVAQRVSSGFVIGGLTSSRGAATQVADGVASGGMSGVLFGENVRVLTRLSQGCTPIGPRHRVTECHRNVAMKLDGRPALEVFDAEVGTRLAGDYRKAAAEVFAALTIRGSDTGDYMVRNLVGIDPQQQWVAVGDWLEPGSEIMFCRRDAKSATEDFERVLAGAREAIEGTPRGGLYFSCLGRGEGLFGPGSAELKLISRHLGEFPLAGFFGNGEVSHDRLYGYTGVLLLFL
ncbi:MAG: FIST C-terminal domain-containing protein [bacterium]|jgi:small ligand-binding sensory domain FIST|nr:FIST C-terminal domain-containing protein [Betaproteobacteria bacterium]